MRFRTSTTTRPRRSFARSAAITAIVMAGALMATACGSDKKSAETTAAAAAPDTAAAAPDTAAADTTAPATDAAPGTEAAAPSGDKPKIKIVENAWTASAVESELFKQIVEKKLGNKVEVVKIDENTMFAGLSSGDLDAVLEIWPSGISADEQKYFDDGTVVKAGELGAVGKIGWWVPDYVVADHPELASSEGFKKPDIAKLFATAETGDKGRFLGTDPSYSQYDETIVKNLDLPLQVVFSGSEAATVAELDSRVAKKEPIVMYWWTPTAAVAKYNLKNVALPAYSDACYKEKEKIACDYPEDKLVKAVSKKLTTKDPAVYALIQKIQLSTQDQLDMLPSVEIDKKPASEVVAAWITAHQEMVDSWTK